MTPRQTLEAARALIADPYRWCQGEYAKTAEGKAVEPLDETAHRFCAVGAVRKVAAAELIVSPNLLLIAAVSLFPESEDAIVGPAPWVNDHLGHEAVLRMFDRAIELAAAEEVGQ